MPIVQIDFLEGCTVEQKGEMVKRITEASKIDVSFSNNQNCEAVLDHCRTQP